MTESFGSHDAPKPARSPGPRSTTVIAGTYRLSHKLGGGAMGEVYEAEHIRLGRRVAVKLLRADSMDDHRAVRRFQAETRALATLRSDHIVSVLDCGDLDDGTPYIVMERLEGEDLRRLLERERSLPQRRAVHLALDVCRALSIVHAAGIVHRDLKPANLFVTRGDRGEDVCKVLDFGVAKLVGSDSTHQGALLGTIRYMAPEQIRNGKEVGPPADLYALGAILYECLGGTPARTGENREQLMFEILNGPPVSLLEHCPSVPKRLVDLVSKALASDPSARFDSADAFAAELEAVLGNGTTTSIDSTEMDSTETDAGAGRSASGWRRWLRRRSTLVTGTAALGLLAGWFSRGLTTTPTADLGASAEPSSPPALTQGTRPEEPVANKTPPPVAAGLIAQPPSSEPPLPSSTAAPSGNRAPRVGEGNRHRAMGRSDTAPRQLKAATTQPASSQAPSGIDVSSPYSSDDHRP